MKPPQPDLRALKTKARELFGHLPGVQGFGIGERALRVYVRDAEVGKGLPDELEGVPIEIVITGDVVATQ
jgi:hypothetical protein